MSTLDPAKVVIEGDSKYVIGLLTRKWTPKESFFLNSTQLCLDYLHAWERSIQWIPREENTICDTLARQAVTTA